MNDEKDAMAIGLLWQYSDLYSSTWEFDDDLDFTKAFDDDFFNNFGECNTYSSSEALVIEDDGTFTAARGFGAVSALHYYLSSTILYLQKYGNRDYSDIFRLLFYLDVQ